MPLFKRLFESFEPPKEPTPWLIERVGGALRFSHPEVQKPLYMSDFLISGEGVYEGERPPNALQTIQRFRNLAPNTLGFKFESWELELVDGGIHAFLKKDRQIIEDEYSDYRTLSNISFGLFLTRFIAGKETFLTTTEEKIDDSRTEIGTNSGKLGWSNPEGGENDPDQMLTECPEQSKSDSPEKDREDGTKRLPMDV